MTTNVPNDSNRLYRIVSRMTISDSNLTVCGNHNTILGTNVRVEGDYNTVMGANATVVGNYNNVNGPNSSVYGIGNYNRVLRGRVVPVANNNSNTATIGAPATAPTIGAPETASSALTFGPFSFHQASQGSLLLNHSSHFTFGAPAPGPSTPPGSSIVRRIVPVPRRPARASGSVAGVAMRNSTAERPQSAPSSRGPLRRQKRERIQVNLRGDDKEADEAARECVVCRDNEKTVISMCCTALSTCVQCSGRLYEDKYVGDVKCPLCNADVRVVYRIS